MEKLIVSNDTFFEEVIALLREGKKVTVPAKGESMLPFIVGGVDSVVLEGVDGGSPAGTVLRPMSEIISSSVASGFPILRFSRTVPLNKVFPCGT